MERLLYISVRLGIKSTATVYACIHQTNTRGKTFKILKMRGRVTFSIAFLCFVSFNSGIPYNDFHINVIKSNGEVGKLETLLRSSVKTTKTFFDDNKSSPDIKTAELKNIIDSAVAALPIIEKALSKENDWMEPMIKAISPEKRLLIKSNLENVGHDLQQILASTKQLSLSKNIDEKNEVEKLKDFSNVAIVQDKLKSIVARFSSGNSLFREYPALAVGPLLGISILIALFTPIRDTIYQNKADDSIISCQLSETLQDYFPLVLHWRLKNVHSINNNPAWEMLNSVIYAIAYNPGTYLPGGGAMHYERHNESDVRCNRNDCNESSDGVCFKDKLQDNAAYAGYKGEPSHNCLVDYLFLVRLRVQELFDTAIGFSNITCSDAMRNRHRQPTGKYQVWFFTIFPEKV